MKQTNTICGMIPWMFWTLLAVVLFALFGPELATIARGAEPAPPAVDVAKERDAAKADLAKAQQQIQDLTQNVNYYQTMRNQAAGALQDAQQQISNIQQQAGQQIAQLNAQIADLQKQLDELRKAPKDGKK